MPDSLLMNWLRAFDVVVEYSGRLDLFQAVLLQEWREEYPDVGSQLSDFVLVEVGLVLLLVLSLTAYTRH